MDVSPKSFTLEITGDEKKIQAVIDLLVPIGIMEIVRTGKVAITRVRKEGANASGIREKDLQKSS